MEAVASPRGSGGGNLGSTVPPMPPAPSPLLHPARGRFAPSPTGLLHIGSARTALAAWLAARSRGGSFVLRIEDLDAPRCPPGATGAILRDLAWLGIDWDEGPDVGGPAGPYVQSLRMDVYHAAMGTLARGGHLFACSCSRKDVRGAASAPHGPEGPVYPGTCRERRIAEWRGAPPRGTSVRFRAEGQVHLVDWVQGRRTADTAGMGDFVVWRADGVPAYQLAVVVDDAAQGVGEVWRGADLLDSTARQVAIFRALGAAIPRYGHVPLVLGPDGQRLAKRHGAISLAELREAGAHPQRIVLALATSLGLPAPGGPCAPTDLLPLWDPSRIKTDPSEVALGGTGPGGSPAASPAP